MITIDKNDSTNKGNIIVYRGRLASWTVTVTGISDWTGIDVYVGVKKHINDTLCMVLKKATRSGDNLTFTLNADADQEGTDHDINVAGYDAEYMFYKSGVLQDHGPFEPFKFFVLKPRIPLP